MSSVLPVRSTSTGTNPPTSSGLSPHTEETPRVGGCVGWITRDLVAETCRVWGTAYGRPIATDEAVEILANVKRLTDVLQMSIRRGDDR